jgi:hypothetical protein
MALTQVFLPLLRLSPVSIIPPMLHTHLHLHVALTRRTKRRSLGIFQKSNALSEIGEHLIEEYFLGLYGVNEPSVSSLRGQRYQKKKLAVVLVTLTD